MTIPLSFVAGMGILDDATPGSPPPDGAGHRPVLLTPLIESLQPRPGQIAVDATFGAGGVTAALIERVSPGGRVIAIDRDQSAVDAGRARFGASGDAVEIAQGDFADLEAIVHGLGVTAVDIVAFDLGISSLQLDDPARGFSFRFDGPLDMRMDPTSGITAAHLVELPDGGPADVDDPRLRRRAIRTSDRYTNRQNAGANPDHHHDAAS